MTKRPVFLVVRVREIFNEEEFVFSECTIDVWSTSLLTNLDEVMLQLSSDVALPTYSTHE